MASWGSFAGGLAQGALQSFSALSRLNREEREMALREEQAAIARAEAAQKDEYGRLLAQSRMPGGVEGTGQGVGQALGGLSSQDVRPNVSGAPALTPEGKAELQQALKNLSPEQATQALRAYGQAYGTPTEGAPDLSKATVYTDKAGQQFATEQVKERTPMEASRRMLDLSAQAGNPYAYEKALGMHATQMQLNKLERDDKFDAQFDAWRTKFNTQAAADRTEFAETARKGPQAILDKYGAEFTKETGQTASLNKDLITLKDNSGKVVGSFPVTQLNARIEPLLSQKYLRNMTSSMMENGLVRNATEAYNFLKVESEIRNQGLTASASMITALARQATVESEIEKNRAAAQKDRATAGYLGSGGGKSIKANAREYSEALVESGKINPVTKQPYTPKEAYQYALSISMRDPNAKQPGEFKYNSEMTTRATPEGIVQDYNPQTNSWNTRGLPKVSENAAKAGVSAELGRNGQVAFRGADGYYPNEREAVESFRQNSVVRKPQTVDNLRALAGSGIGLPQFGPRVDVQSLTPTPVPYGVKPF